MLNDKSEFVENWALICIDNSNQSIDKTTSDHNMDYSDFAFNFKEYFNKQIFTMDNNIPLSYNWQDEYEKIIMMIDKIKPEPTKNT